MTPTTKPSAPAPPPTPPAISHRQLTMFRAIMLYCNLGRAAEACNSSQPTLSRELARLEQLLGFSLFDRVRGRLRPTVRALALLQEVERSFIGLEHIAQRAVELRTRSSGRVRLACLPALAHALVPRALVHWATSHPGVAVSVHPLESPWLEQAMVEQRYDVGVGETTEPQPGVALQALLQAKEVAVLPHGHRLCAQAVLQPQDFAHERFISLAEGDPYRSAIDQMFAQTQVPRILAFETASAVAVCAMVRRGLGVAIVNPLTAAELAGVDLVLRPLSVDIPFCISVLLPQVAAPHPLQGALVAALERAAQELGTVDLLRFM